LIFSKNKQVKENKELDSPAQTKQDNSTDGARQGDQQSVSWMQCLPEIVLQKIMHNLSYQEVYRLGTLCRRLRLVATSVLRIAFRKLVPRIQKEIKLLEENVTSRNNSSAPAMTDEEARYFALSHKRLRFLLTEARVLRAICWRYVRDDRATEFCLPCGAVLDESSGYVADIRKGVMIGDHIPLPKMTQFLKMFINAIEPSLITHNTVQFSW
jgi:hypothetical protein